MWWNEGGRDSDDGCGGMRVGVMMVMDDDDNGDGRHKGVSDEERSRLVTASEEAAELTGIEQDFGANAVVDGDVLVVVTDGKVADATTLGSRPLVDGVVVEGAQQHVGTLLGCRQLRPWNTID